MQKPDEPQPGPEYFDLNVSRHTHLKDIQEAFLSQVWMQHTKGQKEHGGDLWRKACFARLKPEIIDMFTYAYEHEQRMIKWLKYLSKAVLCLDEERNRLIEVPTAKLLIEKVREEVRLELSAETAEEVFIE